MALLKEVRRAIGSDPRADLRPIRIDIAADGTLTLEGEVPNAAVKRLALRRGGAVGGVAAVVDRLRVRPAQRKGDGEIPDHVCNALAQEPGLLGCEIRFRAGERVETVPGAPGNGRGVPPEWLGQRARGQASGGVLAWWVPGSRDVSNGLGVEPWEADSEDTIKNAVRDVLDRDHAVDEARVHVGVHDSVVTLAGMLPSAEQREMAEFDAWYVFGVDDVINRIEVHPY